MTPSNDELDIEVRHLWDFLEELCNLLLEYSENDPEVLFRDDSFGRDLNKLINKIPLDLK